MTATFTTQGISNLQARPLAEGATEITFHSTNEGMYHQLYVNGRLADWCEDPSHRSFLLAALPGPCRLAVLAVDGEHRRTDLARLAGETLAAPPWVFRASIPRGAWQGIGDRLALLGDHATGQFDSDALAVQDVWPAWAEHRGWGQDGFGASAFGYDSSAAPGFACGAFGAGPFGLDGDVVVLEAPLAEEGRHRLVVRRIRPSGLYADSPEMTFLSIPPPAPAERLEAASYDPQSERLTLQLERD